MLLLISPIDCEIGFPISVVIIVDSSDLLLFRTSASLRSFCARESNDRFEKDLKLVDDLKIADEISSAVLNGNSRKNVPVKGFIEMYLRAMFYWIGLDRAR